MANKGSNLNTSTFFITLTDDHLVNLDGKHTIFGQVTEGIEIL
jgi:cyclophilin family peptidyl-prolyl cis-trans isomerase